MTIFDCTPLEPALAACNKAKDAVEVAFAEWRELDEHQQLEQQAVFTKRIDEAERVHYQVCQRLADELSSLLHAAACEEREASQDDEPQEIASAVVQPV